MPPSGMLIIPGVRMEITFYKGLLDKLGLQFDGLQDGQVQGRRRAAIAQRNEQAAARELSKRWSTTAMTTMIATIAADRQLKDYQVKTFIDQGLFTAADAKKAGLIDEVLYSDQLQDDLKKQLNVEKLDIVTNYKKKKIDADFSGVSGMMKLIEIFDGREAVGSGRQEAENRRGLRRRPDHRGQERERASSAVPSIGSTTMVAALKKAADDPKVVAIVLRIDSPGGSATASDLIWRETVRIAEADHRQHGRRGRQRRLLHRHGREEDLRRPGTLTGSIGVIGGKLVTRGLYDKLGLNTEVDQPRGQQRLDVVEPAVHARGTEGLDRTAGRNLPPIRQQGRGRAEDDLRASWKKWPRAGSTPAGWPKSSAWSTSWARWRTPSPPPKRPPA